MATNYRIFWNGGSGGPVDFASAIGTTALLSFSPPALATPSDNRFSVRAFDTVSGLEELNTDYVRIVIDAAGNDITALPNAPSHLAARAAAGGGARASWSYNPGSQGGAPTGFRAWITAGGVVDYTAAPAATVAYVRGRLVYTAGLAGLADGVAYAVGVRAYNATGAEANVASVAVTGKASGPDGVDDLAAAVA